MSSNVLALMGGILIGISSSLMLWGIGRISGISGIYSSVLSPAKENIWKYLFILGLLCGGSICYFFFRESLFNYDLSGSPIRVIIAGLLVGFGTRLGNGCTSGHGVCGISRLAKRSIIATITFIAVGMIVVSMEGAIL